MHQVLAEVPPGIQDSGTTLLNGTSLSDVCPHTLEPRWAAENVTVVAQARVRGLRQGVKVPTVKVAIEVVLGLEQLPTDRTAPLELCDWLLVLLVVEKVVMGGVQRAVHGQLCTKHARQRDERLREHSPYLTSRSTVTQQRWPRAPL